MDPKNRSCAGRRSKRKMSTKSDNYINTSDTDKMLNTMKTRGPYVVRNPPKTNTDDHLDDGSKQENCEKDKKEGKQRKFSSTVISTSLLGKRKFITHEVVKTKRRNKNNTNKTEDTKGNAISDSSNSKTLKVKAKSQSSYKKKNREDGVVYVLSSRNYNFGSVTNTMSLNSKDDNRSNLYSSKEIQPTCSRTDRIADEVLEGWIKRREKLNTTGHTNLPKEQTDIYNLCVGTNNSDTKIQEPSSTKTEKTYIKSQKSITTNESENIYDIDLTDHNLPKKFHVIEENGVNRTKSRFKKPKIHVEHNLKLHSEEPSKTSKNHKDIKRNSKREFINLIKRELQTPSKYKKPRNMFEALKTMARHRKSDHISFDGIASKTKWQTEECDYDNPKLLNSFRRYVPKSKSFNNAKLRKVIKPRTKSPLAVKQIYGTNRLQVISM